MLICSPVSAEIRTPYSEGLNMISGYCTDLDNRQSLSLHFCAQQVKAGPEYVMAYILYVEVFGPGIVVIDSNEIVLVHNESGMENKFTFDNAITADVSNVVPAFSKMTVHYLLLPEIVVRLISEGQEFSAYIWIQGKRYDFIPTSQELKEIRMIANVEAIE